VVPIRSITFAAETGKGSHLDVERVIGKVAQKPILHVPKFTLKTLSQGSEGPRVQNHLIMSHDQVSD
jgi:hypothetical protein